ncbi:TonB-dependent receptor [Hymenobacter caeli]|uniref:TonB-dependent receptor n=1 Tax=Hymenobacter caeli TaxID=2735894 RepID=UPI001FEA906A
MPTLLPLLLPGAAPRAAAPPAAPPAGAPAAATRLSGTVRDAAGWPLPGVNVFLKTTFDGASTDSLGRFAFRTGHAAGVLPLVATSVGYEPLETPVALGAGPVALPNLRLRAGRAALGDVVVTAGAFEAGDARRGAALTPLDVVTTAGALGDATGALNALPGTARNPESGQLFVRGGAAAETKTYLDTTFRAPLRRGWGLNTGLALSRDDNAVRPDSRAVRDLEQSAVARLVLTNDSAATWFNLKVGTELLAQRYRQTYQAGPAAAVRRLGFDERRAAAFAESELVLSRRLAGRAGPRGEYSGLRGRASLAPRAALAYQTGGHSQLTAAWGEFYQTPANDLLRFGAPLGFERAQHLLFGFFSAPRACAPCGPSSTARTTPASPPTTPPTPTAPAPTRTVAAATPRASTCSGATAPPCPTSTTG